MVVVVIGRKRRDDSKFADDDTETCTWACLASEKYRLRLRSRLKDFCRESAKSVAIEIEQRAEEASRIV